MSRVAYIFFFSYLHIYYLNLRVLKSSGSTDIDTSIKRKEISSNLTNPSNARTTMTGKTGHWSCINLVAKTSYMYCTMRGRVMALFRFTVEEER